MKNDFQFFPTISDAVGKNIIYPLKQRLDSLHIYYKETNRFKSVESIENKISKKIAANPDYLMQDMFGCRFIFYFRDDVELCESLIKSIYIVDNISKSKTNNIEEFSPERLNYVCKLPENHQIEETIFTDYSIDRTFEIQLRTVFSEGWLEIEHDLRYKEKDVPDSSWKKYIDLTRVLIGLSATLQNCDWTMLSLMDKMAYTNYKNAEWNYMIKNKFHLQITDHSIDSEIAEFLSKNKGIAKIIFRSNRKKILKVFPSGLPMNINNLIYITCLEEGVKTDFAIPIPIKKQYKEFKVTHKME